MKPYRASLKVDFDDHRRMEVESIYGNPLRAAQQAGAAMPLVETLYRQLKFLDARNRGISTMHGSRLALVKQRIPDTGR